MYNIEWARHSEYYIGVSEILMNYLTISLGSIYFLVILTFPLAENSRRELMQKTVAENCCREVVQRTVGNCDSVLVPSSGHHQVRGEDQKGVWPGPSED